MHNQRLVSKMAEPNLTLSQLELGLQKAAEKGKLSNKKHFNHTDTFCKEFQNILLPVVFEAWLLRPARMLR